MTEQMLRQELAWYKKMPKEVHNNQNIKNLIKLLIRINKLFAARGNAIKILTDLLTLKNDLRKEENQLGDQDVVKQAVSIRSQLLEFREDHKIFGSTFLYEDTDLYDAFEAIQK